MYTHLRRERGCGCGLGGGHHHDGGRRAILLKHSIGNPAGLLTLIFDAEGSAGTNPETLKVEIV